MGICFTAERLVQGGFPDVKRGDWYVSYVAFAKRYGIANGYLDGTFRPEQPVSRAELVKLIASYFTVEGGTSPFPDVPDGHWAAEVVSFAAEEGWVSGYPDGTFRPDAPVSRAEAVKILNHALDRRAGERAAALPFTDVEKGHWACDEIREAAVSHIYRKSGEGETWLTYERWTRQRGAPSSHLRRSRRRTGCRIGQPPEKGQRITVTGRRRPPAAGKGLHKNHAPAQHRAGSGRIRSL